MSRPAIDGRSDWWIPINVRSHLIWNRLDRQDDANNGWRRAGFWPERCSTRWSTRCSSHGAEPLQATLSTCNVERWQCWDESVERTVLGCQCWGDNVDSTVTRVLREQCRGLKDRIESLWHSHLIHWQIARSTAITSPSGEFKIAPLNYCDNIVISAWWMVHSRGRVRWI